MNGMSKSNIIYDNKNAVNHSFLYFLHDEDRFDEKAFYELYAYVSKLDSITLAELRDLYFIQDQVIRHIVYHFDQNDMSKISNLPTEYWKYIDLLAHAINNICSIVI